VKHGSFVLESAQASEFLAAQPQRPLWQLHSQDHDRCAVAWAGLRRDEVVTLYIARHDAWPMALGSSSSEDALATAEQRLAVG
jgi:hypothetical protein